MFLRRRTVLIFISASFSAATRKKVIAAIKIIKVLSV
jgi:hypothetical protein